MSWQTLLADDKIRPHTTSRNELDDLRAVVERDLADAAITALSADRRFATAYNAALQTAKMVVTCAGYRVVGAAHHVTTLDAAELALGTYASPHIAYFDACHRKRNNVDYDRASVASNTEAEQILVEAKAFLKLAEEWITTNHPQFKKV